MAKEAAPGAVSPRRAPSLRAGQDRRRRSPLPRRRLRLFLGESIFSGPTQLIITRGARTDSLTGGTAEQPDPTRQAPVARSGTVAGSSGTDVTTASATHATLEFSDSHRATLSSLLLRLSNSSRRGGRATAPTTSRLPDDLSASQMAAKVLKAWWQTLFQDFLSIAMITTKDYEKKEFNKTAEEHAQLKGNRFASYQTICFAGLCTLLWATATYTLSQLENILQSERLADWIYYYTAVALVFMLLGLSAASFPNSFPLSAAIAGLGGWQSILFMLGTFHVDILKYHTCLEEGFYSLVVAAVLVTCYWALSAQDPLILHILVKLILWAIIMSIYGVWFALYQLCHLFMHILRGVGWFFRGVGECIGTYFSSLVNSAVPVYILARI